MSCDGVADWWTSPEPNVYYDGANCFVMSVPSSYTPFIYDGNYYIAKSSGSDPCPYAGGWDTANCYIGKPPAGTTPFIWNNNFYYAE